MTAGALSQLERGEVNYTQPMLEALADSLQTTPGALVSWTPDKQPGIQASGTPEQSALHQLADRISPADALRLVQMAEILLKDGTNG